MRLTANRRKMARFSGPLPFLRSATILVEHHVEHPMQPVLDTPMTAHNLQQSYWRPVYVESSVVAHDRAYLGDAQHARRLARDATKAAGRHRHHTARYRLSREHDGRQTVPGAQTVAEDTILPIVGVSVADIDSSALTTTLNVSSGILNVTAGAGVTGNGSASVTIAGTAAQINAALAGLTYTGNLDFNGGDTLTVATSDGTATDTDTIAITVNPVNDAPVLNLDADSSTTGGVDYLTTFVDGGPAIAIVDTDVSVIDNDSPNLVSATITLTNLDADDSLTVDTPPLPGGITSVYDSVTGVLTLTGAASAADYQTALLQIRFDAGTNPSTETRIIDVVVNDGTVASNLAHAIVEVTQVNNSAPTLDLDGNNTTLPGTSYRTTFTENGPRSRLRTPIPSSAIPISAARISLQPPSR